MRMLPLMVALDADQDGEISSAEIENASTTLKTLDRNEDGRLDREELRPMGGRRGGPGGPGGPGGAGGPGGPGGPRWQNESDRPAPPPRGTGQGRGGAGRSRGGDPAKMVERIMQFDKDGDGVVSLSDLPERLAERLARADTDGNGSLTKDELSVMAERRGGGGSNPQDD